LAPAGQLIIRLGANGSPAIVQIGTAGVIDTSSETSIKITGTGALDLNNGGLLQADGSLTVDAGIALQGSGTVQLVGGGAVTLDGSVASGQSIVFEEPGESLTIRNVASFEATILNVLANDTIDLKGIIGNGVRYDANTGVLDVVQSSTSVAQDSTVASLHMPG